MAIGTATHVSHWGESPMDPTFHNVISFVGPASYTTGGDTGLLAALQTATNQTRTILYAKCINGNGYLAEYIQSTDKVKVYGGASAAKGAGVEVDAATNLSGSSFVFEVVSK